ncbi:signal peptide peptidase SppA [Psychromonas sp. PT13]|uniref:signal peptide peptidase SppA n=1 Tax=Psychromonas sp. PT13 TaxID=3439547 RepID=UPI003EB8CD8E
MKRIFSWLKTVAKVINFTRLFVINAIFLIIIAIFILAINVESQPIKIAGNSTLDLNFKGFIVEQKKPVQFSSELSRQLLADEQPELHEYQIDEVLQVIRFAQHDPRITSILLELDGLQGVALNHITSIGKALTDFKSTGKKVTAIADNYSQSQYLLASFADEIHLNPQGLVFLQGFSVYRLYFKEALDNLLITPHIFKVGTYKSFVEPFTENKMSSASKQANSHWLNQLWNGYIDTVLTQRQDKSPITKQSISPSLSQLKAGLKAADGDTAKYAKQVGLVDGLSSRSSYINQLQQQADEEGNKLNLLGYDQYQAILPPVYEPKANQPHIALIHGSGEILAGNQPVIAIGGDSFSKLLAQALTDDTIKAVVIRLDTPGGSAFASEKIRQQVLALKSAGKKVVVSMGSVTASGGYWIASAADAIVASPSTLTGSIGIFGMYASAEKALQKLGIHNDGVSTSPLSSLTPTRALDPELAEIMQMGIEHGYQQFLQVVAQGRNMSVSDVDKIAQGRVWTGVDGLNNGLVDKLGNLNDAINEAASLANIDQYTIKEIGPDLSTKQHLLNELFGFGVKLFSSSVEIDPVLINTIKTLNTQAGILTRFNDPQGRYAFCPMCNIN